LKRTCVVLDHMVSKGIIHKNKAANVKSKLSRFVNKLS
jgi:ribosomal protein S20